MKYRVCSLDVWGNEFDGFEVNDVCSVGFININDIDSNAEILQKLIEGNFLLVSTSLKDIVIDGDIEMMYIEEAINNMPIFQLRKE